MLSMLSTFCAIIALSFVLPGAQGSLDPTTWNYNTGLNYVYFAYAAYCPQSQLENWTCKWCQNNTNIQSFKPTGFPYDSKTDTFAFVGYSDLMKQIVVSFRGTHDLKNWIVDLEFAKMTPYKNYTGVQVHDGFDKAYSNLKPQIFAALNPLIEKNPSYDIIITGHSLGAALATLLAVDVSQVAGVVTPSNRLFVWHYGCPRVGNSAFSQLYTDAVPVHYRHTNNRDIVPHLPPEVLKFYHCPTEVWERGTSPSDFTVCNGSGEDPKCSDSLLVDLSISDHLHYFGVYESCS